MGKLSQDIENAFVQMLKEELAGAGRDVSSLNTNDDVLFAYFTETKRFLKPQKRYLHIPNNFVCPTEYEEGYKLLENKIRQGISLNSHLSRTTKNVDVHDLLLYDWGIYHFHLGTTKESDGYTKRTKNLLYAYVTDTDVYEIGIFEHGKWNDTDLLESLHRNFPFAIQTFRVKGEVNVNVNDAQHKTLRNSHINVIVTLNDGTSYMGPGWGINAAGTSADVSLKVCDMHREFVQIGQKLVEKYGKTCESYTYYVKRDGEDIVLKDKTQTINELLYHWIPLKERISI